MRIFKPKKIKQCPFSGLFKRLSPEEFVNIFHAERIQTLAFILHYAARAYAKKTLMLIKDENIQKTLTESLRNIKYGKETVESEFAAEIEKAALEYIGEEEPHAYL